MFSVCFNILFTLATHRFLLLLHLFVCGHGLTIEIEETFEFNLDDFVNTTGSKEWTGTKYRAIRCGIYSTTSRLEGPESTANMSLLSQIYFLKLDVNEIATIDDYSFFGLSKLNELYLQHNRLTTIRNQTFAGLSALSKLRLDHNSIETIGDDALNLPHLIDFSLANNELKRLSDNMFQHLHAIKFLDIRNNGLEHIGRSFFAVKGTLQELYLANNRIHDIDLMSFSKYPKLRSLGLSRSGFSLADVTVDESAEESKSPLSIIDISKCNITDAFELNKLKMFPELQIIELCGNDIKNVRIDRVNNTLQSIFPRLHHIYADRLDDELDIIHSCGN